MDKELISMCSDPRIQSKWEPKLGDRVWVIKIECFAINLMQITMDGNTNICWFGRKEFIFIPSIETVLEWLSAGGLRAESRCLEAVDNYINANGLWDTPVLHSALAHYMEFKHSATWDGEAWNE